MNVSSNRVQASAPIANAVACVTLDWLLDVLEHEQQHYPPGCSGHEAMERLRQQILAPSPIRVHALNGKIAEVTRTP